MRGGGGGGHKALVSDCLPLAAPIDLSPLLILTLCGPERVSFFGGGGGQRPSLNKKTTGTKRMPSPTMIWRTQFHDNTLIGIHSTSQHKKAKTNYAQHK